jgi:4-amino-4-deoxy-L-arabinose transferase-like glycosyltransferase
VNLKEFINHYRFFLFLILYFTILTLIKLFGSLEYDDAEQAIISLTLKLGYDNAQPPLYNYLQYIFFNLFGYNKFAIFVLKHIILFGIYLSIYFFALDISKSHKKALTASILTLFLPQIFWQSELMLNHSVLAALFSVLFFWQLYKISQKPSLRNFILIALIAALGFLSKYSFAILFLAFLLYSLKKRYPIRYIFISIALFIIIASPHLLWIAKNFEYIKEATLHKTAHHKNILQGVYSLVKSTFAFLAPLILVLIIFRANLKKIDKDFLLFYMLLFSILGLLTLFGFVNSYKERWLLPFLTPLPAILAPILNYSKRVEFFGYVLMVLLILFFIIRVFFADFTKPTNSNLPIKELSKILPKGVVKSSNLVLEGNFALYKNGKKVIYVSKTPKEGYKKICHNYLYSNKEFCIYYKERD